MIEPFRVDVPEPVLVDLRQRLAGTRWPDQIPGSGWDYGADTAYLRELCAYWASDFDWRTIETASNRWPQFVTFVEGQRLHFVHARSPHPQARPLLLVHGWPSTSAEFAKVLGPLTDPPAYGGRPDQAFHVIAPTIPGYGWSGPTTERGWSTKRVAGAIARLMDELGYDRFAAHGTDFGSVICTHLATLVPERVTGLHITLIVSGLLPHHRSPTPEEESVLAGQAAVRAHQFGYVALQSTKPQTLSHALADSPVGQAAWIVEKFHSWTDHEGDLETAVTRDELLANVTTYWVTGTGGSSARLYFEDKVSSGPAGRPFVSVPTAFAAFPKEVYPASRSLAEEYYNIQRWTPMARGGHFAALEQPELLVEDLRGFFVDQLGASAR